MSELMELGLATFAGLLLGGIFFTGLWWTVRALSTVRHPALWFLGSYLGRISLAVAGFYFVSQGELARLIACLLGFLAARIIVLRATRPSAAKTAKPLKESPHAS